MNGATGHSEASVNIPGSEQLSSIVDVLYFCVTAGGSSQQGMLCHGLQVINVSFLLISYQG